MSETEKELKSIRVLLEQVVEGQRRQERRSRKPVEMDIRALHRGEMVIPRLYAQVV